MPRAMTPGHVMAFALATALAVPPPAGAGEPAAEPAVEWAYPVRYSLAMMGVGIVGLVATRQADDDPSLGNFVGAFRRGPRRDDDSALYNLVLHPLWGSETYLRAREAHMGVLGSFGFSLGASVTWEYLIESWTEHPSTQDLILTTGLGWMLGELRHQLKQRTGGDAHRWIDPLHEALEHVGIGTTGAPGGKDPVLNLSYRF